MSASPNRRELALDLPAAHSTVPVARRVLRHFARLMGLADGEVEILMLVSSELLGNAIDHGGGEGAMEAVEGEARARMKLRLSLDASGWTFRVSDEGGGEPADVEGLLSQDGVPDLEDERGRGFFLVAQMVDRLGVEKSADGRGLTFVAARAHGAD
ncbi:MAG: ATP-binding protein [Planctomycetota bacterium]